MNRDDVGGISTVDPCFRFISIDLVIWKSFGRFLGENCELFRRDEFFLFSFREILYYE